MVRDPITGAVVMPGQNVVGADPTRNLVPSIQQPKQVVTGNTITVGGKTYPAPTQAQFDAYNSKVGMVKPVAAPSVEAAAANRSVQPVDAVAAGQKFLDELDGANMTPEQITAAETAMTNRRANADMLEAAKFIKESNQLESQNLAAQYGNTVEFGEDGSRIVRANPQVAAQPQAADPTTTAMQAFKDMQTATERQIAAIDPAAENTVTGYFQKIAGQGALRKNLARAQGMLGDLTKQNVQGQQNMQQEALRGKLSMQQQGMQDRAAMDRTMLQEESKRIEQAFKIPAYQIEALQAKAAAGDPAALQQLKAYTSAMAKPVTPEYTASENDMTGKTLILDKTSGAYKYVTPPSASGVPQFTPEQFAQLSAILNQQQANR